MKTQAKRQDRLEGYREQEQGVREKYILATTLLEDIWLHLDWEDIGAGRRMKIWQEFENQVKGLSRCYSSLEPFITKLCKRFGGYVNKYETKEILAGNQEEILEVYRHEVQVPMLLLRLRSEKRKEEFNKNKLSRTNEEI